MFVLKVPLKDAEKVRMDLIGKGIYDINYMVLKEKNFIFLPVKKKFKTPYCFSNKELKKIERKETLKQILSKELSNHEIESLKTAFDVVGDIAILEVDDELKKKQKLIAEALLKTNKNVKTVLKKGGVHGGEFRTQKMVYLAGKKTKETVHKENNIQLKLNVEKVYFSPRLSTERKRIAGLVKKGEEVLVMFSGCAPYPCVLSKNTKAWGILGVELNPAGHKYGRENLKLNKLKNVALINGDVKKVIPKLKSKFDRILMPLPKSAEDFLDTALLVSKKGTIIHFYDFLNEKEFDKAKGKIDKACKKNRLEHKILRTVKCGQHAPHVFRICVDFEVGQ